MRAVRFPALLASLVLLARFAPVVFASAFLTSAFFVSALAAEKYPSRPVHWIVGFAAGGPNDIVARIIGEWLSDHLGQQFVIENRVGSGGMIAANAVINSPPMATPSCSSRPTTRSARRCTRSCRSMFLRDTAPVAGIMRLTNVMVVPPDRCRCKTVAEFIAYAKANPGKLNYRFLW